MVAMWSELTADDQATLLSSPILDVTAGCELLNFDLTLADDTLTDDLDPGSGTVQWTGAATVHRGCTVTLARRLDWGNALIRLYRTYTAGPLSARANRGVFCLVAPDTALGEAPQSWQVNGQDRLFLLNRQVGYSYVIASGTNVLTALRQVFTDAGLTGVVVDSSRSDAVLPTAMTWPLTPATDSTAQTPVAPPPDSGTADTSSAGATTWQQIVNDLQNLINYRPVWCDDDGLYRCGPYIAPEARPAVFAFDADTVKSTVGVQRTESGNYYASDIPNLYVFLWSNQADVSDGAGGTTPATPTEGSGIYTRTVSTGPTSSAARNGLVWPIQVPLTAASQTDLVAQGEKRVAADLRLAQALKVTTVPFPAGHFDVYQVTDSALDGSPWTVEATAWTEHLDGSDTEFELSRVGSV